MIAGELCYKTDTALGKFREVLDKREQTRDFVLTDSERNIGWAVGREV